jgi:serine phosphatase RsbU (regulator of sigma subunit)
MIHDVESHALQCMEIWGGNRSTASHISVTGIDGYVFSKPYRDGSAGGDIHYVSLCGGGNIARIAVADVSGHGDAVGELAVQLRSLMRRHINTPDQTRFLRVLNREFGRLAAQGTFATALLATYFAPTDHLIIVNAGHPRPLLWASADAVWRPLQAPDDGKCDGPSNLPLGIIDPTDYCQFAVQLQAGDRVMLYTDSLVEAMSPDRRLLGEKGLIEMLNSLPPADPQTMCNAILQALETYRGGASPDDDITLLLLQHNAQDPPRQTVVEWSRTIGRMLGLLPV